MARVYSNMETPTLNEGYTGSSDFDGHYARSNKIVEDKYARDKRAKKDAAVENLGTEQDVDTSEIDEQIANVEKQIAEIDEQINTIETKMENEQIAAEQANAREMTNQTQQAEEGMAGYTPVESTNKPFNPLGLGRGVE